MFDIGNEHCAQPINSEFVDARTQRFSQNLNPVRFGRQTEHRAQPIMLELEGARTQKNIPDSNTVKFDRQNKHGAQEITSQFDDARTQKVNSGMTRAEIHAEGTDTQHILHFEEADDLSETGSLITQAPQSESTRHDQRAIVVGVGDSTKRIMVLGRVDTRLPHGISGRPRGGGQCNINTEL